MRTLDYSDKNIQDITAAERIFKDHYYYLLIENISFYFMLCRLPNIEYTKIVRDIMPCIYRCIQYCSLKT